MEGDDRRVEPRTVLIGRGVATDPQRLAELEARAKEMGKLNRPKPARSFSQVLAMGGHSSVEDKKKDSHEKLPRRGPRPALVHPAQRKLYGRQPDDEERVVLKG